MSTTYSIERSLSKWRISKQTWLGDWKSESFDQDLKEILEIFIGEMNGRKRNPTKKNLFRPYNHSLSHQIIYVTLHEELIGAILALGFLIGIVWPMSMALEALVLNFFKF